MASRKSKKKRARSRARRVRAGRVLLCGVVVLVGFLYYRPLTSYLETRRDVDKRRADVVELRTERARLERRLARTTSVGALSREARRMGYVKPGEQLFIVKGIPQWRRARAERGSGASTLRGDG